MDLDFSFALVSSLTPRSQVNRAQLIGNNEHSTKSLKTKQRKRSASRSHCRNLCERNKDEKENQLPKEQLMNKNDCFKSSKAAEVKCNGSKDSISFPVDMTNIAVRKNRGRGRPKTKLSPLQCNILVNSKNEKSSSSSTHSAFSNSNVLEQECNKNSGIIRVSAGTKEESPKVKRGVKRKSPQLIETFDSPQSSLDIIESSPPSGKKYVPGKNIESVCKDISLHNKNLKTKTIQINGISESSLSSAYDSDSFQAVRRNGVKTIPETPETDESLKSNVCEKRKSSLESVKYKKCKNRNSLNNSINSESDKNKAGDKIVPKISPPPHRILECFENTGSERYPKKKLRSSNESALTNMFTLESSIKKKPPSPVSKIKQNTITSKVKTGICRTKKDKQKLSISPVLKEINTQEIDCRKTESTEKNKLRSKEIVYLNLTNEMEDENTRKTTIMDSSRESKSRIINNHYKKSPINICLPKCTLVPPSEVIPKFEHINNWLKDTQEKFVISSSDSSFDTSKKDKHPRKPKNKVSLSPRIKKKQAVAKTSLEEEQKLFADLYSSELTKRLSDDVDEIRSNSISQEPVELSENVLDKLYGSVWQKNAVLTQSEPRKNKKKNPSKKKAPSTERKKHRTSIYEVFSSSSSEGRFEEFLENVQRGKIESTRRRSGRLGTPEFINDSESDLDTSLAFYQNFVSSSVKKEVDTLRKKDHKSEKKPQRVNRRRLSFTSSKDDCSEGGKSESKEGKKEKKVETKDKKKGTQKSRSKKKEEKDVEENYDINGFTLVTPLKLKDKKASDNLNARLKKVMEPEVPRSVGKSKTPKKSTKSDGYSNTEDKLKASDLKAVDFKVPKFCSTMKTPSRPVVTQVPSSPALSFLSSLSEMTAGLPCHPDALVFKKDFKNKKEELTKKLFSLYNREIFESQLPNDMVIEWNVRMRSTSGFCYNKRSYSGNLVFRSSRIVLSTKILDRADRLRDTLIHELCHAATWIVNGTSDGHGPSWKAWADKANRRFPELPVIKRCHDYAISTKFTYKCMTCGYCIGRHTKSLNIDRKRCGYCYGKFQVFVTAKMSSASATSGSDSVKTPKNPTGFALFVKENYALIKKDNNLPHGQVMKLLSQKFAEVKISKQTDKAEVRQ